MERYEISELLDTMGTEVYSHDGDFLIHSIRRYMDYPGSSSRLDNADALLVECWESLHSGYYMDIREPIRTCFVIASILRAQLCYNDLDRAFYTDRARIVGSSNTRCLELLETIGIGSQPPESKKLRVDDFGDYSCELPSIPTTNIQELADASFEDLILAYRAGLPFVLRGGCSSWSACKAWGSRSYWANRFGSRYVPVEIGGYLSTSFEQGIVTLTEFIDYISNNSHHQSTIDKVYLAQYDIIERFSEIEDDISPMPDFVQILGDHIRRNIFFGPAGTVSPMHYDPDDNFLCQVFGSKYVRLHDPTDSRYLYQVKETTNMTELPDDICTRENIFKEEFPLYQSAKKYDTILRSGDCLFIPKTWWHFVKSFTPSASIATFFHGPSNS